MKTKKSNFFKVLYAFLILFALSFNTDLYASSGNSKSWKKNSYTNYYKKNYNKRYKKNYNKRYKKHFKKYQPTQPCKPDSIPLDGGLSILLVGAAAFGVKKLRDNKNDKF